MVSEIDNIVQGQAKHKKDGASEIRRQMKIVSTNADFDALENDWTKLFNESDVTVYQSYEWLRTWWKYFAKPNFKLHIMVFYCDNKIEGIAPLFLETVKLAGIPFAKRLQFLGRGLSDYVNFILLQDHEEYIFERFANYLASSGLAWNLFDIEDVNEETKTVQRFPRFAEKHGLKLIKYQGNICPQVSLPDSPDLLIENMGPSSRHNLKRKIKKLQDNYQTAIDIYMHETDNLRKALDEFSEIHSKRWKSLGHPSAFDSSTHKEFHLEFSKNFAHNGWLRIYILRINNEPVATSYGFYFRKRMYMYQSNAYCTEDVMRLSPGQFLRSIVMADGIKENMEVFDYMRGDEPYKFSEWRATFRKNYLLRIKPNRLSRSPGFILYLIYELIGKCRVRVKKEYYEYRRFLITKPRTVTDRFNYIYTAISNLFKLGYNFLVRHSSIKAMRQFELKKDSPYMKQDDNKESL